MSTDLKNTDVIGHLKKQIAELSAISTNENDMDKLCKLVTELKTRLEQENNKKREQTEEQRVCTELFAGVEQQGVKTTVFDNNSYENASLLVRNTNNIHVEFPNAKLIYSFNGTEAIGKLLSYIDNNKSMIVDNAEKCILLSTTNKQVFSIPINTYLEEMFDMDMELLKLGLISFAKDKYGLEIFDDDIIVAKATRICHMIISSIYINNTHEKHDILHDLFAYLDKHPKYNIISDRISRIRMHNTYPNVERIAIISNKTLNKDDIAKITKDTYRLNLSNIEKSKLISVSNIVATTSNSTINNVDNSVESANNNAIISNPIIRNKYDKIALDKKREYINYVESTPPTWHKKGKRVSVAQLYKIYKDNVGGEGSINQFGKFLCKFNLYRKAPRSLEAGARCTMYDIIGNDILKVNNTPLLKNVPTEIIYLLQRGDHIDSDIFKIGRTNRNIKDRINEYPKRTFTYMVYSLQYASCVNIESIIIKKFNAKFIKQSHIGNEYYKGDKGEMIALLNAIIQQYDIPPIAP